MAHTPATPAADPAGPAAREAFGTVRKYLTLFGAVGAIVLATVAVTAATGHRTTPFLWVRGTLLLAAAPLLHRYAARAAEGSPRAFDRLRALTTTLPVAVVAVDLVPGLCPAWYAVLQGLSALSLAAVAVLTRGAALRAAFPGGRS
jgi:hypothetical protein